MPCQDFFGKICFWKKSKVGTWVQNIFRSLVQFLDMSPASEYMGANYFQEFGPMFFDMSSASGYMGAKYFQKIGPRFLA